jgi:hypothetical protein
LAGSAVEILLRTAGGLLDDRIDGSEAQ